MYEPFAICSVMDIIIVLKQLIKNKLMSYFYFKVSDNTGFKKNIRLGTLECVSVNYRINAFVGEFKVNNSKELIKYQSHPVLVSKPNSNRLV